MIDHRALQVVLWKIFKSEILKEGKFSLWVVLESTSCESF